MRCGTPLRIVTVFGLAATLHACERSTPMRSLDERCAGVKVALIRNDSRRPIEMYARMDTVAALLIGVVAARSTVELPLPVGTTRLFTFDTGSSSGEPPPLTISYKCVVGAPRPARAA